MKTQATWLTKKDIEGRLIGLKKSNSYSIEQIFSSLIGFEFFRVANWGKCCDLTVQSAECELHN